ncbi:hypothetical protein JTB14_003401 [Gonioctena quinquepunctata]|nr:hypothetical protein JTB14_003401 [Gonioctena quinquepunctata]
MDPVGKEKQNNSQGVQEIMEIKSEQTENEEIKMKTFYRRVTVNGIEMTGLIDHGSLLCINKESVVRNQRWQFTLGKIKLYGYGCGEEPVGCVGLFSANVGVDLVSIDNVTIAVVSDNMQNFDIIIRRLFTEHSSIPYYRVDS